MKQKLLGLAAGGLLALAVTAHAGDKLEDSVTTGFKNAEALTIDPATDTVYISVVGEMNGKDGDGYIAETKLGELAPKKFIDGLNGPKGAQIANGKMFVVEVNAVLVIDLATRDVRSIELPNAGFLLDLAVNDGGEVFVTDPPNNAIYRIHNDGVETFIQDQQLAYPNGIEVMGNGDLLVASWGVVSDQNTWATSEAGRIVRIDTAGKIVSRTDPLANLDGIERSNGRYIATGFNDGVLYSYDPATGSVVKAGQRKEGLADVAFHGDKMYSINFNTSELAMEPSR